MRARLSALVNPVNRLISAETIQTAAEGIYTCAYPLALPYRLQSSNRACSMSRKDLELARDLRERGGIDLEGCFVDGTFAPAKKGGGCVGKTKRGKGTKIMAIADGAGLPVAVCIESASPHEVTLVDRLLRNRFLQELPERIIGDMAYDSDRLDRSLEDIGVEMIAPHRSNRVRPATQDRRPLRRYRRRWKVERLFAWL
ncbi:MAG: transposase [Candidatus Eremiobacteraeota bacterium]|nr:transposase [Candidatus Eremiobacteraeota bacterium]MBC5802129.1 transposase [Candidatus Eremiobacteraeota bacterium]